MGMSLSSLSSLASAAVATLRQQDTERVYEVEIDIVQEKSVKFYHYCCDSQDDRGWGCGYQTAQSLCSWAVTATKPHSTVPAVQSSSPAEGPCVPSIKRMQEVLVEVGDKPESFINSREWIGCYEVSIVLDHLYGVPCRLLHIHSGAEVEKICVTLQAHFKHTGAPVMIGGDVDASSKTLIGVAYKPTCDGDKWLFLVADPHYIGDKNNTSDLADKAVKWHSASELFIDTSFYNFCLPMTIL